MENRFTKKIEERIYKNILEKKLFNKKDILIVSVSGGPDSTFLLYILNKFNIKYDFNLKINVIHLNHMLREEADSDEEFVKKLCLKLSIPFYSKKVDINKKSKEEALSIELAGRKARKDFVKEVEEKLLKENNLNDENEIKIVYGHHADDVVETFIFNAVRGASLEGLSSIKEQNKNVVRPILFLHKEEILKYLKQLDIPYVIDKTNYENTYNRNKIRNVVISYLEENINDKASYNIYNAVENLRDINDYLNKICLDKLNLLLKELSLKEKDEFETEENIKSKLNKKSIKKIEYMNLNEIKVLDDVLIKNIVSLIVKDIKINSGIIEDIFSLIKNNRGNKYIDISNICFLNKNKKIYIIYFEDINDRN